MFCVSHLAICIMIIRIQSGIKSSSFMRAWHQHNALLLHGDMGNRMTPVELSTGTMSAYVARDFCSDGAQWTGVHYVAMCMYRGNWN